MSSKPPPLPNEAKKPSEKWEDFGVIELAGLSHENRGSTVKWLKENNPQGFKVEAIPEPENEHDKHAVAVYGFHGKRKFHIGYLPRGIAKEVHKLELSAELVEAHGVSGSRLGSFVSIRLMGKKENSSWGCGCLIIILVIIVLIFISGLV